MKFMKLWGYAGLSGRKKSIMDVCNNCKYFKNIPLESYLGTKEMRICPRSGNYILGYEPLGVTCMEFELDDTPETLQTVEAMMPPHSQQIG